MIQEKDVEQALVSMVRRQGGLCLKWVCPGWAGVPDRIILMPGGRVYFAELKRPKGGKLSKLQIWWHQKLRGLGFWVLVIKDNQDIQTAEVILRDEKAILTSKQPVPRDPAKTKSF